MSGGLRRRITSLGECSNYRDSRCTKTTANPNRFERTSILQQAGFLNREELHSVDIEAITKNPKDPKVNDVGFFKLGRWVWDHDPERYATDNYEAVVKSLREGQPFSNTNLPPGHKYEPWTLETEGARMMAGIPSTLKKNGYWGTETSYFKPQPQGVFA